MDREFSEDIQKLLKEAGKEYASKNFEKSSEVYAEICELYNADTQEDNENLMFLYGKSLFQLAVSNSEVLGGSSSSKKKSKDTGEPEKVDSKHKNEATENKNEAFTFDDGVVEEDEDEEESEEPADTEEHNQEKEDVDDKEEDDDGNGEEEGDNQNGEGDEEEINDFEEAWTILDISRTLFEKKLETLGSDHNENSTDFLQVKKKLSETYDILGEVSLESENYMQASQDFKKSLDLRKEIFDFEKQNEHFESEDNNHTINEFSALISESYYKLSLALEFLVDVPGSRKQAADCMRLAIEMVKIRGSNEQDSESQSILAELQERLEDLQQDPLKEEKEMIMKGLLGNSVSNEAENGVSNKLVGGSDGKKAIVNDLTGSVVKKRKGPKIMKPSTAKRSKQK